MFEITVKQANDFNSPIIKKLMFSEERAFPVRDAYSILNLINQARFHLNGYNNTIKKTIEDNNGKILHDGKIKYPTVEDRNVVADVIENLNKTKIELVGNKVKLGPDWPKLTLAEVSILGPIIDYV